MNLRRDLKRIGKSLSEKLGWTAIRYEKYRLLQQCRKSLRDLDFLKLLDERDAGRALNYLNASRSANSQDFFVLSELGFKEGGYFIEFGAADGILESNTYLLEKMLGWHGILAEPAKYYQKRLKLNRTVDIEFECVWNESGKTLLFSEVDAPNMSTVAEYALDQRRSRGKKYHVRTISLEDLLIRHQAPFHVDYLSIDTEGSEYQILRGFDFSKYRIAVVTVEHNFRKDRDDIYRLLSSRGYVRKFEAISDRDDWYVLAKRGLGEFC
jgi:FkbM family methyltransferase